MNGLNKGMSTMKSGTTALNGALKKLGVTIAAAFSTKVLIDFSKEASKLATTAEASVQRLIDIYGEASKAVGDFIDANANALGMSKTAAASYASVYGNLFSVWADQKTNAELTNKYLNMTAVIASKTGRTVEDVQERIRSGLLGNTEAIEDLGVFVNVKTIEMTDAFQRMADGKSWEQLDAYTQQQIRTFAILEQSTQKYGDEVAETTALTKSQFQAAWQDFQATWGQVVNKVLVPILEVLTDILVASTNVMQKLFGISSDTVSQSDAISSAKDNQAGLTKEINKSAKAQKKLLAGFDDLQILSGNASESAGGGALSGTGSANATEGIVDFLNSDLTFSEWKQKISLELDEKDEESFSDWVNRVFTTALGNVDMRTVLNVREAAKKLYSSIEELGEQFKFDINFDDWLTRFSTKVIETTFTASSGVLTILSGAIDIVAGVTGKDGEKTWEGGGKTIQGAVQTLVAGADFLGIENFLGVDVDKVKEMFFPITEEVENLYKGLTPEQSKIISDITKTTNKISDTIKKNLGWTGTEQIVTEEIKNEIMGEYNSLYESEKTRANQELFEQMANINALLEGGLIDESKAEELYREAQNAYNEQIGIIENSKNETQRILEEAAKNEQALSKENADKIKKMLKDAQTSSINIVKGTADDTSKVKELMAQDTEEWSKAELASVIKYANDERDATIEAANQKYDDTVASINALTGLSEEEKAKLIQDATEERDETIRLATEKRNGMVEQAQKAAGEIADYVDPETSEILSNWEVIWNKMYGKVSGIWEAIKTFWSTNIAPKFTKEYWLGLAVASINGMIDGFEGGANKIILVFSTMINWIIDNLNKLSFEIPEWVPTLGGHGFRFNFEPVTFEPITIPRLARGAVIPPNREFLAILGDQKQGTNIEAPLETIVNAFNIALAQGGGYGNTEVVLEIDGREFGRAVVEQGNRENRRIGTRLVIA
jgi:hypothetical protein